MAKATLTLPDGTHVSIDGTPEEIAKVMGLYGGQVPPSGTKPRRSSGKGGANPPTSSQKSLNARKGPKLYIAELIAGDFFDQKRSLRDIQKKLEEHGHIYALESLSTPVLRLVRNKELRRIKEDDVWLYISK